MCTRVLEMSESECVSTFEGVTNLQDGWIILPYINYLPFCPNCRDRSEAKKVKVGFGMSFSMTESSFFNFLG